MLYLLRSYYLRIIPLLFFMLFVFSAGVSAQNLDSSFKPVTAGTQYASTGIAERSDGKLVLYGNFEVIGGERRSLIAVLNADETIDTSFDAGEITTNVPQSTPVIGRVVSQTDGKLIISGNFTHINGVPQRWLARLNTDGSLDTSFNIGTGPNTNISQIQVLPGGKILVGGLFTTFNNQSFPYLVRLNSDGSIDQTFTAFINGMWVTNFIVQSDGKIIAVGEIFSTTNGQPQGIVRLNANGSVDSSFNPGTGLSDYSVNMKLQPDGKLLISGEFTSYNGTTRIGIARINSNGSLDTSFNASSTRNSFASTVSFLLQNNGQIVIGGSFDTINGVARERIARLNADGTLDQPFAPVIDQHNDQESYVTPVHLLPDQRILIAGRFVTINQTTKLGFARLNTDGTPDPSFSLITKSRGFVYALASQSDGKILVGGAFSHLNGVFNFGIGRLNADGTVDMTFNSGGNRFLKTTGLIGGTQNGYVQAIAVQDDGKILVGGNFNTYDNVHRNYLARLNADGSLDTTFATFNSPGIVNAIVIQPDSKILVAGDGGLRRFNTDGTTDSNFNTGIINDPVRDAVLLPDGKIIIGGFFTRVNGITRNRIARLNSDGSLDLGFDTSVGASSNVYSIALKVDGKILIGGNFTTFNGTTRTRIAQLNADGTLDTSFDPASGANSIIFKIMVQENGKILIGGRFTSFDGVDRKKLARLFSNGSLDTSFGGLEWYAPETQDAVVYTMLRRSKKLIAGGNFSKINGQKLASLLQLTVSEGAPFDFNGDGKTDIGIYRPSVGEWWINYSTSNQTFAVQFGSSTDKTVTGDYTGDGKTDIAFWRPSSGEWFILRSEDNSFYAFPFGQLDDIPAPGDFDGDGKADAAVFRPADATWYILRSSDGGITIQQFGISEDKPVVADYDGDGKDDIGIYRPSVSEWWILRSSLGLKSLQFGQTGDKTVQGDYTGDGKADVAFYRPSSGEWFILRSEDDSYYAFPFGTVGDIPAPGDYDGDGKFDAAVFRPSNSTWYLQRSTGGFEAIGFGMKGDVPIPNSFVR